MIYLTITPNLSIAKKTIKKILDENKIQNTDIHSFYFEDNLISFYLESQIESIFDKPRVLVCHNSIFFASENKLNTKQWKRLNEFIDENKKNPNIIIFSLVGEKFSSGKKAKEVRSKLQVYEINKYDLQNIKSFVSKKIENSNIEFTPDAINFLIKRCKNNYEIIENEINKYIQLGKRVDKSLIEIHTYDFEDNSFFNFSLSYFSKDLSGMLNNYEKILHKNISEISLIALLVNDFDFLLEIKLLEGMGKTKKEINEVLKLHPFRFNKLYALHQKISNKELATKINEIYKLEKKIKHSNIKPKLLFQNFIINHAT